MNDGADPSAQSPSPTGRSPWNTWITVFIFVIAGFALGSIVWITLANNGSTTLPTIPKIKSPLHVAHTIGVIDSTEPSGMAPPGVDALPGYTLSYMNEFFGSSLPVGWDVFTGVPGGDPGGQFAANHVVVDGGLLHLNTWKDPKYQKRWVTGGLCQCGLAQSYRAYFVRSRVTGVGPNEVQLLWPADNTWPPEIDFSETGEVATSTSWTMHYGSSNSFFQQSMSIDMTKWHTWGVIWTPSTVSFVVDGTLWGVFDVRSQIPHQPMTLDLEERTECSIGRQCPTVPVSMLVDWVAEYKKL